MEHFADSQERRLKRLLTDMPLGDQKPSELYNEMKRVGGTSLNNSILLDLWISRLPPVLEATIIATTVEIGERLKIADFITDSIGLRNKHMDKVTPNNEIANLKLEIAQLMRGVQELLGTFR